MLFGRWFPSRLPSRRRPVVSPPRRLLLETLEARTCPVIGGGGGGGWTGPVIDNFAASEASPGQWVFTGQVVDPNGASGLTVDLGGDPQSVQGVTATTASDGTFSVAVELVNGSSDTGNAQMAQVTDSRGTNVHPGVRLCGQQSDAPRQFRPGNPELRGHSGGRDGLAIHRPGSRQQRRQRPDSQPRRRSAIAARGDRHDGQRRHFLRYREHDQRFQRHRQRHGSGHGQRRPDVRPGLHLCEQHFGLRAGD